MACGSGSVVGDEREVNVSLGELKFCAAHFVAFKGFREPLHGHNYQVGLRAGGSLQADGYLTDFGVLKKAGKAACKSLDQKTIVPIHSDVLQIEQRANGNTVEIACESGARLSLPKEDCAFVPIAHSTAEELSEHLWWEILIAQGLAPVFQERNIRWFEVHVSERPGQGASYRAPISGLCSGAERPRRQINSLSPRPCLGTEEGFLVSSRERWSHTTARSSEAVLPRSLAPPLLDAEGLLEATQGMTREEVGELAYKLLLSTLGPDESSRPVLQRTPARAAKAFREMTVGLTYEDPLSVVGNGIFDVPEARDMVAVRDMTFHSMCEHHLLPFSGVAHVAYIPDGKVLGLSKFPRLLQVFARRLQLQERLSAQFADAVEHLLHPKALAVALEATHGCMCHRGVGMAASTRTLVWRGPGKEDRAVKEELSQGVCFLPGRARL